MKFRTHLLTLLLASVAVTAGGCRLWPPKTPTGQVVATVGDREITVRELQAELGGAMRAAPADEKAQRRVALDRILQRVILADAAKREGLDKDPNYILLSERANDALLVQMLQQKVEAGVPAPTMDEAANFEESNPDQFAERKIFDVEQIRTAVPTDRAILTKLKPLNTLDDIAAFLTRNNIAFQRSTSSIDAIGQNPKLIRTIVALPRDEVFIITSGNSMLINHIVSVRTVPLTGQTADKYALYMLRAEHAQEAVQKAFGEILNQAKAGLKLSKEFQATPGPVHQ